MITKCPLCGYDDPWLFRDGLSYAICCTCGLRSQWADSDGQAWQNWNELAEKLGGME